MLRLNFRPPKKNLNRKTREFAELFEIYLLKAIRSMSIDVGCRSCVIRTTFQSEIVYELFEAQNADFLRIMSLKNIYEILTKKCVHWFSKNLSSGCISASPLCLIQNKTEATVHFPYAPMLNSDETIARGRTILFYSSQYKFIIQLEKKQRLKNNQQQPFLTIRAEL